MNALTKKDIVDQIKEKGLPASVNWYMEQHDATKTPEVKTYKNHLSRIYKEFQSISKSKSKPGYDKKILVFNSSSVQFPEPGPPKKRKIVDVDLAAKSEFSLKVQALENTSYDLGSELNNCKKENEQLKSDIENLKSVIRAKNQSKKKVQQREQHKWLVQQRGMQFKVNSILKSKRDEMKRLRSKATYYQQNNVKLEKKNTTLKNDLNIVEHRVQVLEQNIDNLNNELETKQQTIEE